MCLMDCLCVSENSTEGSECTAQAQGQKGMEQGNAHSTGIMVVAVMFVVSIFTILLLVSYRRRHDLFALFVRYVTIPKLTGLRNTSDGSGSSSPGSSHSNVMIRFNQMMEGDQDTTGEESGDLLPGIYNQNFQPDEPREKNLY